MESNWSCAFCLKLVAHNQRMICAGCKQRSYCSKQCQKWDWEMDDSRGQGHKVWCGQACGEEGVHWAVQPVSEEKGFGIVALNKLPKGFRIMVERGIPKERIDEYKYQISQLVPKDAALAEKWDMNAMADASGKEMVCLKMARVNHSCDENAERHTAVFGQSTVEVLYALREIEAGEEICISYIVWTNPFSLTSTTPTQHRELLSKKWNVTCPADCRCYNKNIRRVVAKAQQLHTQYQWLKESGDTCGAFQVLKEMLRLHDENNANLITIMQTLEEAFLTALHHDDLCNEAKMLLRRRYELEVMICTEESNTAKEMERCLAHYGDENYFYQHNK